MLKYGMELNEILASAEDLEALVIGRNALSGTAGYIEKYWPGCSVLIVADTNTWNAAGKRLYSLLKEDGAACEDPLIFDVPPYLHADYDNVLKVIKKAEESENPVLAAVGSGTINDLVKRASFETGRPYLCVGTAASMDGYCSSGAALSKNGRKQTMECPSPKVVIADTEILKSAPAKANAAGYGDLASKLTAGADWIIADFVGVDPIEEKVWNIIQPKLKGWLESPEAFASGDEEKLSGVFEGLNLSGLAMQILGRSRPAADSSRAASGAEHMFSHIWEMSGHLGADGNPVSHGFQVSLGIMCVTAMYELLFSMEAREIDIDFSVESYPDWETRAAEIEGNMKMLPSWEEYLGICRMKYVDRGRLRERLTAVKNGWDGLRIRIREQLPSYDEMKAMLNAAGCPVRPSDIDMDRTVAIAAYAKTQCMRNRYTVFDLAYDLGVFSKYIDEIDRSSRYLR